jgi:hypothetical protein
VLKRSLGFLAIAAVVVACSSAGAFPARPESNVSERDRPSSARALPAPSMSAVSEAELLATFDSLAELPGFQGGGLTPEGDEVLVYWNGQFGPEAQATVEEAHRRGVEVNVVPVSYSFDELREMAGSLVEALAAEGIETEGYGIGPDEIAVWGIALESAAARRVAEDTAADLLPSDVRFAIIASPGAVVPAD